MTAVPPSYQQYQPPQQPPATKSSSGCLKWSLIGCGVLLFLGAAFTAAVLLVVLGAIRSSDVFRHARDRAAADPRVIAALGTPIETGWLITGSIHADNSSGDADFTFSLSGPRGKASVQVEATLEHGSWKYTRLLVHPDRGEDIDVLHSP